MASEAAAHLEGKPAERIVAWAAGIVPRFAVTSSFGAESAVLLHMVSRVAPQVPVIFLDTDFHFSETIDYRRRLARELGVTVLDVRPALSPAQQAARLGDRLFDRDPDTCCALRKTEPLRRALTNYDGWATGVRRVQTPERAATPVVEARRHDDRWLVKVAPLAGWTDDDVVGYQRRFELPVHPLVRLGYRSIGCRPCTTPVSGAEDARAGRWVAFGKTECGLHLPGDEEVDRLTTTPG
ncbi:MAG: phosphoadenylyl-sulfate reductase [Nitriliruptorales bacterium]|nr:phosphoadenylyl-sulfate reductase [Nitriliruptorales bacterium]